MQTGGGLESSGVLNLVISLGSHQPALIFVFHAF